MTTQEREILIERYGSGELSRAEETMIEKMAASDPAFAAQLQAERTLRSAARRDIASIPALSDEPSAQLLSLLAATPPAAATGASGGFSVFSPLAVKFAIVAAAVVGILVGAFIFGPGSNDPPRSASSPSLGPATPDVALPQPSPTAAPGIDTGEADHGLQPVTTSRAVPSSVPSSGLRSGSARASQGKVTNRNVSAEKKPDAVAYDRVKASPIDIEEPVVFTTDSVRTTIRIDEGRGE